MCCEVLAGEGDGECSPEESVCSCAHSVSLERVCGQEEAGVSQACNRYLAGTVAREDSQAGIWGDGGGTEETEAEREGGEKEEGEGGGEKEEGEGGGDDERGKGEKKEGTGEGSCLGKN